MTDERRREYNCDRGRCGSGTMVSSIVVELTAKLKAAEDEIDGYRTQLTRLQADFVNFRRRIERERAEQAKYVMNNCWGKCCPWWII